MAAKPKSAAQAILVTELLADLVERDPVGFHRRLWSEHLFYAQFYDESRLSNGLDGVREHLVDLLDEALKERGKSLADVTSVLEIGCSVGHVLGALESLLPEARRLLGIDIDRFAVELGRRHFEATHSLVELRVGDAIDLGSVVGDETFDLVIAAGVLLYLDEAGATQAVSAMLRHAELAIALADIADPDVDNALRVAAGRRSYDHAFIHNLDAMVEVHGGIIGRRYWGGSEVLDGQPLYLVVAFPSSAGEGQSE